MIIHRAKLKTAIYLLALLFFLYIYPHLLASGATGIYPPAMPNYDYPCRNYTENYIGLGTSQISDDYWVFQPAECNTTISSAPLVVMLHGWGSTDISTMETWVHHAVMQGNIVIFPLYMERPLEGIGGGGWYVFVNRTADAIKNGITWLQSNRTNVQPDLNKFAIAGGSMGAYVTINLAAAWNEKGLPKPGVIVPVHPPGEHLLENLNQNNITSDILINCFVGEEDSIAGRAGCDAFWNVTNHVARRDYVFECSDYHGEPAIVAEHKPSEVIEWYGEWKSFDGLMGCAFYNRDCDKWVGNTPEHRYMGEWSDGVSVKELGISNVPPVGDPCPPAAPTGLTVN